MRRIGVDCSRDKLAPGKTLIGSALRDVPRERKRSRPLGSISCTVS